MSYPARADTSDTAEQRCMVALHCSLGSGRQWAPFMPAITHAAELMPEIADHVADADIKFERMKRFPIVQAPQFDLFSQGTTKMKGLAS